MDDPTLSSPRGRRRGTPLSPEQERERAEARRRAAELAAREAAVPPPRGRRRLDATAAGTGAPARQAPSRSEPATMNSWVGVATLAPPRPLPENSVTPAPADPWVTGDDAAESDAAPMPEPATAPAAAPTPVSAPPTAANASPPPPPRPAPAAPYRAELQGLRAVAIAMVVTYHIWFGRVSGGVDVFLLISAFLLTGSFARKIESGQPLRIPQYWLHAFRRLVPPAALVILLTLGGSLLLLPATRWVDVLEDCVASLLYAQNWLLVSRSVDYFAANHAGASPLQHFWSLSMQGQVFLLWPLLFGLVALVARRRPRRARVTLIVLFGLVMALSLTRSVIETATHQTVAYFDTSARLWEFSLGSLLALVLPGIERRLGRGQGTDPSDGRARHLRAGLAWLGLALILACGWVVNVRGAFPGWIALWPLLSACLVVAAGPTGTRWGADRLLSSAPLRWLGDISYALYLVHWPLLVLALAAFDARRLDALHGLGVVVASVLLAWLVTRGVDAPLRRSAWIGARWWRGMLAIAVSCALVGTAVATSSTALDADSRRLDAQTESDNPGARILLPGQAGTVRRGATALPPLYELPSDFYEPEGGCTGLPVPAEVAPSCDEVYSPHRADAPLVVVAGNSHAMQALPMLIDVSRREGWRLVSVARPACSFGEVTSVPWCGEYDRAVIDFLHSAHASALVTYSTYAGHPGVSEESESEGFTAAAQQVTDAGIPVLGLRDVPRLRSAFVPCLDRGTSCSQPVSQSLAAKDPGAEVARRLDERAATVPGAARMTQVDLTASICPDGRCVPEIGNVYTYVDDNHLTATYSATLGPALDAEVRRTGFAPR